MTAVHCDIFLYLKLPVKNKKNLPLVLFDGRST